MTIPAKKMKPKSVRVPLTLTSLTPLRVIHASVVTMWRDVVDLRDFYETQLGEVSQQMIHNAIRQVWPDMTGGACWGSVMRHPI